MREPYNLTWNIRLYGIIILIYISTTQNMSLYKMIFFIHINTISNRRLYTTTIFIQPIQYKTCTYTKGSPFFYRQKFCEKICVILHKQHLHLFQGNVKELFGYTNGVSSLIPLIQHEKQCLYKRVICTSFT